MFNIVVTRGRRLGLDVGGKNGSQITHPLPRLPGFVRGRCHRAGLVPFSLVVLIPLHFDRLIIF